MNTTVILACGHDIIVNHDSGGRVVRCTQCSSTSVVQAVTRKVTSYQVSELPEELAYDGPAESTDGTQVSED